MLSTRCLLLRQSWNLNSRSSICLSYARFPPSEITHRRGFATIDTSREESQAFDQETDVVVVGAGAAGLSATLRCHDLSLSSIIVEKTDKIGGTSALSGGEMWIPNNAFSRALGHEDSEAKALSYMNHCIGDAGPASSKERRKAFVRNAPMMVQFLQRLGFQARASGLYPNYYPDLPGGDIARGIESTVFNARKLGRWYGRVRKLATPYPPVYTDEFSRFFQAATSVSNMLYAFTRVGIRGFGRKLLGQIPVTLGPALVCQLLHLNVQRQTPIWTETSLDHLLVENGRVVGVCVWHRDRLIRIGAKRGVLLVAGGFARNAEMRKQYQKGPTSSAWTSAQEEDLGDAISIGQGIGAKVALMDDAWWGPTVINPTTGQRFFLIYERAVPHCIIVDSSGQRFMNEAQSYIDAGHAMYRRNRQVGAIPAWLILDYNHRRKYSMADMLPGYTPKTAIESGFVRKAATIRELAEQIGVDAENLGQTVARFNKMARDGNDQDFGRGANCYDQFFADDLVKPNGNLGEINKAPFYAVQVWPGDLGTKGGLLTDELARVVGASGQPIHGLYAAGNSTASVMGRSYPGPGSTLAPALTFSFIAVNDMAASTDGQRLLANN